VPDRVLGLGDERRDDLHGGVVVVAGRGPALAKGDRAVRRQDDRFDLRAAKVDADAHARRRLAADLHDDLLERVWPIDDDEAAIVERPAAVAGSGRPRHGRTVHRDAPRHAIGLHDEPQSPRGGRQAPSGAEAVIVTRAPARSCVNRRVIDWPL
jgi:hypothetical protein